MSDERNVVPEKTDYKDCGEMPDYDDETKPFCNRCMSLSWVIATGRTGKWKWTCTNCTQEWEPFL